MPVDLTRARVLVVGASGGIGGAAADAFAGAAAFGHVVLPAGRVGRPGDVARAIPFLATNPCATGPTVTVDGGGTIAA